MKEFVHFTADWCQPCKRMEPEIAKFLADNVNLNYIKIDIEKSPELFEEYSKYQDVKSVPTFFIVKDGELLNSHIGATTRDKLQLMVD